MARRRRNRNKNNQPAKKLAAGALFIDPNARVPVSIDPDGTPDDERNTVYIASKMTIHEQAAVQDAILSVDFDIATLEKAQAEAAAKGMLPQQVLMGKVSPSQQQLALLIANIKAWSGPGFEFEDGSTVPCTAEWIRRFDPSSELMTAVLIKIDELNAEPVDEETAEQHAADDEAGIEPDPNE